MIKATNDASNPEIKKARRIDFLEACFEVGANMNPNFLNSANIIKKRSNKEINQK